MNQFNPIKNSPSFTLIEMIVTMLVFSIIIGAGSGLFISAIRVQSRTLATQQLLDQTSYALEYMSRALRMAKKDDIGGINCLSGDKTNYEITHSGQGIKFRNYNNECQEFFLDLNDHQLKETKNGGIPVPLIYNFYVESFNIGPSDSWDQNDKLQPKVTIYLEIRRPGSEAASQPKIKIQTTISQRRLDIEEN